MKSFFACALAALTANAVRLAADAESYVLVTCTLSNESGAAAQINSMKGQTEQPAPVTVDADAYTNVRCSGNASENYSGKAVTLKATATDAEGKEWVRSWLLNDLANPNQIGSTNSAIPAEF